MISIREMIDSGFLWLFTVCVLPLCLTVPALGTAVSAANSEAPVGNTFLSSDSDIDTPEVLVPKPPPPPPTD